MMRDLFHDFGFELKGRLPELIQELNRAIQNKELVDCICEEIRTEAHCIYDEEEDERADAIIHYYYYYRWDNYNEEE